MKRTTTLRNRNSRPLPLAWREAEYTALRADVADTTDDRVSQNIFDIEDERTEIDFAVHAMMRDAS
jgi:hypothetical protein